MSRRVEIAKALQTAAALEEFSEVILGTEMTKPSLRRVLATISEMKAALDDLEREIDPVRLPAAFFDPTDPTLVGYFVALALIVEKRQPLASIEPFYGSGVYAVYYRGPSKIYAPISGSETPVYVGKADPPAGAQTVIEQETKLYSRLREHIKSINRVEGIELKHFEYRALAVQSGYQSAAESYLIQTFQPIWNNETRILFGIGKHGDKSTTRANNKSPWDTVHPGRAWAAENAEKKTRDEILEDVAAHFRTTKIFQKTDDVYRAFAEGIRKAERLASANQDDDIPIVDEKEVGVMSEVD